MPRRYGDDFEVPTGPTEVHAFAKKEGVALEMATYSEFHSDQITLNGGKKYQHDRDEKKMRRECEEIPGLRCPDCNAQAFKTDHPKVAVCGNYPGWYFFYRRLQDEKEDHGKKKYIIRNGQIVEVDETATEVGKQL